MLINDLRALYQSMITMLQLKIGTGVEYVMFDVITQIYKAWHDEDIWIQAYPNLEAITYYNFDIHANGLYNDAISISTSSIEEYSSVTVLIPDAFLKKIISYRERPTQQDVDKLAQTLMENVLDKHLPWLKKSYSLSVDWLGIGIPGFGTLKFEFTEIKYIDTNY